MTPTRAWRGFSTLPRRFAVAGVTVLGVTFAAFVALSAAPGDPLASRVAPEERRGLSPQEERELRTRLGLDRPVVLRYLAWSGRFLRGDLGESFQTRRPVADEIRTRLWPTVELNLAAFLVVTFAGLPLGWWAGRRPGRKIDRWSLVTFSLLYAAPSFWVALVLQNLFAVHWRILPLYGRTPPDGAASLGVHLQHLVLPALCLALHQFAFFARFARNTSASGWRSGHALCARAAGVPDIRVFFRHAVRPSLVPLAALLGLLLPAFASGAVLMENIFAWPGLGFLFWSAVETRDAPVVMGLTALVGILTVAGSLLADLLGQLADPRARRGPVGA